MKYFPCSLTLPLWLFAHNGSYVQLFISLYRFIWIHISNIGDFQRSSVQIFKGFPFMKSKLYLLFHVLLGCESCTKWEHLYFNIVCKKNIEQQSKCSYDYSGKYTLVLLTKTFERKNKSIKWTCPQTMLSIVTPLYIGWHIKAWNVSKNSKMCFFSCD